MSEHKDFYKYEYHGLRGYYLISWTEFDGKICEYSKKKEWKQNNKLIKAIDFVNGIGFLPNSWKKMLHREKMTIVRKLYLGSSRLIGLSRITVW